MATNCSQAKPLRRTWGHGPGGVVDLEGADRVSGAEGLRLFGAPLLHAPVVAATKQS